jgi:membrane-bound lytic murein transglycosylase B
LGLGGLDQPDQVPGSTANPPATTASATPAGEPTAELFNTIYSSLQEQGIPKEFIDELAKDPGLQFDEKFIRRNLLNFLQEDNYRIFLTKESVSKCRLFLRTNAVPLKHCEKKFKVPKEVITALLWVETKHGHDLGRHHLASVFMNLALADRQEILDRAIKEAHERSPATGKASDALNAKVKAAAKRKSAWAKNQLVALAQMHKDYGIDVKALKGSYSGAFGMPQFVPESFVQWAADGDDDGKIDLFNTADAICSVANYLKTNGWGKSAGSHRKAVYHYNHSSDYGTAVLTLARKLKQ